MPFRSPRLPPGLLAALTGLAGLACQGQNDPGCRITQDVMLPAGPLDTLPSVRIDAVGTALVVLGTDPGTGQVAWADPRPDGTAPGAGAATVDAAGGGPWLAAAASSKGFDLAVVWGKTDADGLLDLWAEVVASDGAIVASPLLVVDKAGPPGEVEAALLGTGGGPRAVLTHGARDGSQVSIDELLLRPTLRLQGGIAETAGAPGYRCPAGVVNTTGAGAFLMHQADDPDPTVRLVEIGPMGITQNLYLGMDVDEPGCFLAAAHQVGPGPAGGEPSTVYSIALQAAVGTYLFTYDTKRQNLVRTGVVGALRWGGQDRQPPLAALAWTGDGYALVFARPTGPEARRLDAVGHVVRGPLSLPVSGKAGGPVASAWVDGLAWVTYLDDGRRRLAGIDCKAK